MPLGRPTSYPVTTYALCTALGTGRQAHLDALGAVRSGLGPPPMSLPFATACGVVSTALEPLPARLARHDARITRMVAHLVARLGDDLVRAVRTWGPARFGIMLDLLGASVDPGLMLSEVVPGRSI